MNLLHFYALFFSKMTEFVVILPALPPTNRSGENASQSEQWREGGDGVPPFRSTAKLLVTGGREWDEAGGWALLRIVPRNASTTAPIYTLFTDENDISEI